MSAEAKITVQHNGRVEGAPTSRVKIWINQLDQGKRPSHIFTNLMQDVANDFEDIATVVLSIRVDAHVELVFNPGVYSVEAAAGGWIGEINRRIREMPGQLYDGLLTFRSNSDITHVFATSALGSNGTFYAGDDA